uniref:Gag-pol polyprotein n=1 Tax=Gongylonema pulchrum TaxID=637853 RepID=A0A183D8N1_9BILA
LPLQTTTIENVETQPETLIVEGRDQGQPANEQMNGAPIDRNPRTSDFTNEDDEYEQHMHI